MRRKNSLVSSVPIARFAFRALFAAAAAATLAVLLAVTTPAAGAQQHEMKPGATHDMKEHGMSSWKEMDAFHAALGAAFHPTEKGNLAPLKATTDTLAARAKAWGASTPPSWCASDDSKASIVWLATRSADLAYQVRTSAADATLKEGIAAIHEKF
jgi:hypothetical protein